ncbi:MAG: exodeoxyribonuclease VII large subunit [Eubacteriaceae bacterium]|nr:exodeoxyribonuclease VII large subunit [Eubacteriaceae bacterium]
MANPRILSVSEVNQFLKTLLESNSLLKNLMIQGELSNVKRAASGHLYFSLKDTASKIDCVMFKNAAMGIKFIPKEGMKVTLRGSLGVYPPSGQYQITVRSLEPQGQGDLYQAYLALKDELSERGYFDPDKKKKLPKTVSRVGLVTSPTGAAVSDMITIIKRRNPLMDIVLYPSLVQGDAAAENISAGIRAFNVLKSVDVIIIGRGGGSIEDLWAFNDKNLAKVIFDSELPIISAVGHEIDFTIADFVADIRAPTPSGAAELVAEETLAFINRLDQVKNRLMQSMNGQIRKNWETLFQLKKDLMRFRPRERVEEMRLNLDVLQERLLRSIKSMIKENRQQIKHLEARLEAVNPENVLNRGYVLVTDKNGIPIGTVKGLNQGQELKLRFKDGESLVRIESIKEN